MSERAPQHHSPEQQHSPEAAAERLDAIRKELEAKAESQHGPEHSVEQIARTVEQHAISGKEMSRGDHADNRHHPVLINKQLKDMAYSRTMVRVRKRLSAPSRLLSRAVHSKVLERPSELASTTIARPSSMLGGAFIAAIGTSLLLWITKRYGYEYNYLAIVLLFAAGMILGLGVELAVKRLKKR